MTKEVERKEFNLEQAFALWERTSKKGNKFMSGDRVIAYYNHHKQKPTQCDIEVHIVDADGFIQKDIYCQLWVNISKESKKYLSGYIGNKKVVGFYITEPKKEKSPSIVVYYSDDNQETSNQGMDQEKIEATVDSREEQPF